MSGVMKRRQLIFIMEEWIETILNSALSYVGSNAPDYARRVDRHFREKEKENNENQEHSEKMKHKKGDKQ